MEYKGFISTLIDRSEQLLLPDSPDDLNVTRLLLVLNTGFAMVRDRIRYWEDEDDRRLRTPNPWKDIQKASKAKLGKPISMKGNEVFEQFRRSRDWGYFRLPKESSPDHLSARNIVEKLRDAEGILVDELKLEDVMFALRNSFAHGGVLPMSTSQAGQRLKRTGTQIHDATQIDRVYFVSKQTRTTSHPCGHESQVQDGWIVMEFGVEALQTFWEDWKAFILTPGRQALTRLELAA